ncbi:MAG: mechanosensitive ion channel [Acidobacteria bacterium]|nr:mechanosensitive ion channel [Acidobacteriota bacterium]
MGRISSHMPLALEATPFSLLEHVTFWRVMTGLLVLLAAWVLVRYISRLFALLGSRVPRSRFLVRLLEPAVRIGVWFAVLFIVFSLLAPTQETFLAAVASLGLALGLGAQDLVKNIVGGLVVLADRPYQLGDRVKIGDAYGEIDHIGLRSTKLTTPDDTRVTIPNLDILNHQVFNANSGVPDCQVVTDLYLPPDTDPGTALKIGHEAAYCSPYLLARKPIVARVAQGFDRIPYLRLRIKAYVYDHRFEPAMQSDITARASAEFLRLGILQAWRNGAATPMRPQPGD